MLGDGVHFHFRDAHDAVRASLDVVRRVRPRGLPPAHVGVNAGPMIYEEGDYFGRAVNIAARISAQASADQVFVGEDLAGSLNRAASHSRSSATSSSRESLARSRSTRRRTTDPFPRSRPAEIL